jgi:prepilin-type N-terminal cleavage/methylation domain-containing protein
MGKRGFTLIETAIVMTIAGLMLAGALQYYTVQLQKQRYETTRKRLEDARSALTIYAAANKRLPCPASPLGLAPGGGAQGGKSAMSREPAKSIADACAAEAALPEGIVVASGGESEDDADKQAWTGILPLSDLRLGLEQAQDGWGNMFTYSVSRRLTLPDGMRGSPPPPGILTVQDENGESLIEPPASGRYVVVSHGPSGEGAWNAQGGRKPCREKDLDGKNCDGDASFTIAPFSRAQGKYFFDDFVIHDDMAAGGSLLDRLVICNAKKKFYVPADPGADPDGCRGPTNVWEGACLQAMSLGSDGKFVLHPPLPVMQPSFAQNNQCVCPPGYSLREVSGWDDTMRTPSKAFNPWTNNEAGKANPAVQEILKFPEGQEVSRNSNNHYTRTILYTCTQ